MDRKDERIADVHPDLVRRTTGGWLAVSPSGSRFSLGVTAPTEREALEGFRYVFGRWVEILELENT